MKTLDYYWARTAAIITGIMWITQTVIYALGAAVVRPGFEWVYPSITVAFALSLLYSFALILINAYRKNKT